MFLTEEAFTVMFIDDYDDSFATFSFRDIEHALNSFTGGGNYRIEWWIFVNVHEESNVEFNEKRIKAQLKIINLILKFLI